MRLRIASLTVALLLVPLFFLAAQVPAIGTRHALVIGNSNYAGMPRLKNPVNDAADIAAVLAQLGFEVTLLTDASRRQMNQAIIAFRETLAQNRQSEGIFFFAGHGVQSKGMNYLIPVGADIRAEVDLDDEAVSAQKILGSLEEARNRVNFVILDACRDSPLPGTLRSSARGLAVVTSAPPETLVLYSTAAGQTAFDGEGRNSPFTQALLAHLADAGDVTQTVKVVTGEVKKATGGRQTPYVYMGLSVDFEINNQERKVQPTTPAAASSSDTAYASPPETPKVRKPTLSVEKPYGSIAVEVKTRGMLYLDGVSMGQISPDSLARLNDVEARPASLEVHYEDGHIEKQTIRVAKNEVAQAFFTHVVTNVLPNGAPLPVASIKIDGSLDDWKGIRPAFVGKGLAGGLHIDKVHLAADRRNLYLRFDVNDSTAPSSFHPDNFDRNLSYGLELQYGRSRLFLRAYMGRTGPGVPIWLADVLQADSDGRLSTLASSNGHLTTLESAKPSLAMKGSSLEASFDVKTIVKGLELPENDASVRALARTGVFEGIRDELGREATIRRIDKSWQWDAASGEQTDWKQFAF